LKVSLLALVVAFGVFAAADQRLALVAAEKSRDLAVAPPNRSASRRNASGESTPS